MNKGFLLGLCLILSAHVSAGFITPGTIADHVHGGDIVGMEEGAKVTLHGYLIAQLQDDRFEFQDESGLIQVRITDEAFRGLVITPHDKVRLKGKILRETGLPSVDVSRIEFMD